MDIYFELSRDYRYFEEVLARLSACSRFDHAHHHAELDELRTQAVTHACAEDALFNARMRRPVRDAASAEPKDLAETVEADLRRIQESDDDASWTAAVQELDRDLRKHIREDEAGFYPRARKLFSYEEAVDLGNVFHHLKQLRLRRSADEFALHKHHLLKLLPPPLAAKLGQAA